ncbi:MAG: DUF1501 domain-containing protein, partial [Isosphaeraceae bacterium]
MWNALHSRREVLKSLLGGSSLLALSPTAPAFLGRAALAARSNRALRDTVLVVVQLAGGNDGLNTVVPYGDDLYAKSRSTLRLPASKLHRIDSLLGFHPRMEALARLFDEGLLSVVQGVGYPNPNGDHIESMHIWQTADLSTHGETGWIGRTVDHHAGARIGGIPAAFVGQIRRPFALSAARAIIPTISSLDDGLLHEPGTAGPADLHTRISAAEAARGDAPFLDFLRKTTLAAYQNSQTIERAAASASTGEGDYPPLLLARSLRLVARLIRADLGLRIIYTELGGEQPGGFDNHANQADNHAALLHHLSESVSAFVRDLKRDGLLDRVLLMTFSEFGRTVRENGRRGTDHGSAAPLFLAGGKVTGGLIGPHPKLSENEGGDGLKHHTDFRRVYATVLDRWLEIDSVPVLGARFEPVGVLRT